MLEVNIDPLSIFIMKIKKLKAGVYSMNIGSQKALKKNGFNKEGLLKKEYLFKKKRIDCLLFGKML